MMIYITLSLGLTKLKRRELVVSFYPVLLFILAVDFLLGVFTGYFNYK